VDEDDDELLIIEEEELIIFEEDPDIIFDMSPDIKEPPPSFMSPRIFAIMLSMSISTAIWPPPISDPISPSNEGIGPPVELDVAVEEDEDEEENDIEDVDLPSSLTVEAAIF
jgi:hypothetical protein